MVEGKKIEVRVNTYTTYRDTAEKHVIPYFKSLDIAVQKLTPAYIQRYYTEKSESGLKPETIAKHRTVIHDSLEFAVQTLGIINSNPADRVKLPKSKKRVPSFYKEEQLKSLFKAVKGESIETAVILSATYGLRRSEVLGLQWSVVDFKRKTIAVKHTVVRVGSETLSDDSVKEAASFRTMPLTSDIIQYLNSLKKHQDQMKKLCGNGYADNDYICKWDDGKLIEPDYLTSRFNRFLKEKGLPHIRFHDLRHSSASLLINNGFNLKEVQDWLGHASIKSTDIYAHLLSKSKEGMAEKINSVLSMADDSADIDDVG